MMAERRLPHPWPALMILVCAALLASPTAAANWKFRAYEHARIEVNGNAQTDGRLLATDAPGIYLVELPFDSKYVLVDVRSRSAILLMRSEVKRVKSEDRGNVILIDQRSALATPSYALRSEGRAFDFQTDISSVHVDLTDPKSETEGGGAAKTEVAPAKPVPETPASPSPGIATEPPGSGTPPVADSAAARACVRLETIPSALTPGCTKSVYVRNTCDRPVVAVVGQTQRLMSGPLSDRVSVPVPPRGETWVACAWWSGAMAPATHDLIGTGFVEPPPHHGHGGHRRDGKGP
ncbi:MAG TPA: hypothetical protein VGV60_06645 [Candidatus Polarisedimenticolia bacterium]|nr:hypothetical protein [Candidatus Polarisedimenticolia bacterium]